MIFRILASLFLVLCVCGYCLMSRESPVPTSSDRFTKLDKQGEPLPVWAGPWNCVHDSKLSLVWEVKTDNENIHDGYWSYSWFDGQLGKANQGDCFFEANGCDVLDLISKTQQERLCGFNDWRLPTPSELSSLISQDSRPGDLKIVRDYFPSIKAGDYWTSQHSVPLSRHYSHLGAGAQAVNFKRGEQVNLPYRNAAFVLLVADHSTNQF